MLDTDVERNTAIKLTLESRSEANAAFPTRGTPYVTALMEVSAGR